MAALAGHAQSPDGQLAARTMARLMTAKVQKSAEKLVPVHSITYDYDGTNNSYLYESDYTYNADGTLATEVQREQKTLRNRISHTYDPVATSFLTLTTQAAYDATTQTWGDEQTTYRYDITRNADGQITKMVEYDTDEEELTADVTIDITYLSDGTPDVMTVTMVDDLMGDVELTLSGITWTETTGQIADVGTVFSLISGGKQVEKATMGLTLMGLPLSGPLSLTYAGDGSISGGVSLAYFGTTYMSFTLNQTLTDAYGSYQLDVAASSMGEKSYSRTQVTIDDHGNTTQSDEFEGTTADDLEKIDSEKTEYSYVEFSGVTTVINYMWDEDTDTHTPYQKVIYDEFATGIQSATSPTASAPRVYSLGGTLLGTSTDALPAGTYIVRQGDHAVKVVKR